MARSPVESDDNMLYNFMLKAIKNVHPGRPVVPDVCIVYRDGVSESQLDEVGGSRRRDCHAAATPSTFIRCFNRDKTGGVIKMTVSPTAGWWAFVGFTPPLQETGRSSRARTAGTDKDSSRSGDAGRGRGHKRQRAAAIETAAGAARPTGCVLAATIRVMRSPSLCRCGWVKSRRSRMR